MSKLSALAIRIEAGDPTLSYDERHTVASVLWAVDSAANAAQHPRPAVDPDVWAAGCWTIVEQAVRDAS